MSHSHLREEKNCLNCGALVEVRFCTRCGQQNTATHQSAGALVKHFIYDVLHFDGKFFETLKGLLTKPGWVARSYATGQRMSFLDPIRMYLFTSAVFFLVLFKAGDVGSDIIRIKDGSDRVLSDAERNLLFREWTLSPDSLKTPFTEPGLKLLTDTTVRLKLSSDFEAGDDSLVLADGTLWKLEAEAIGPKKIGSKSDWLDKFVNKKMETVDREYGGDQPGYLRDLGNHFVHSIPLLLFLSLPFFALILKFLYLRRKAFYYSDHATFTLYHYIFTFLVFLAMVLFSKLGEWMGTKVLNPLSGLLFIFWLVYLYLSMRRFYGQSRIKTFLKFTLLNFLALFSVVLLFFAGLVVSLLQL